jgi:hypothetical protein
VSHHQNRYRKDSCRARADRTVAGLASSGELTTPTKELTLAVFNALKTWDATRLSAVAQYAAWVVDRDRAGGTP